MLAILARQVTRIRANSLSPTRHLNRAWFSPLSMRCLRPCTPPVRLFSVYSLRVQPQIRQPESARALCYHQAHQERRVGTPAHVEHAAGAMRVRTGFARQGVVDAVDGQLASPSPPTKMNVCGACAWGTKYQMDPGNGNGTHPMQAPRGPWGHSGNLKEGTSTEGKGEKGRYRGQPTGAPPPPSNLQLKATHAALPHA
eukprot:scaffold20815_cov146-Isochrysis_galbana.AAC.5